MLFVHRERTAKNPAMELMITAMLHKTDDTEWMPEELRPVKDVRIFDITPLGSIIVVGRGILGFNFEQLVNVVDMTGSQNIDRIFQLMARVVRTSKGI